MFEFRLVRLTWVELHELGDDCIYYTLMDLKVLIKEFIWTSAKKTCHHVQGLAMFQTVLACMDVDFCLLAKVDLH